MNRFLKTRIASPYPSLLTLARFPSFSPKSRHATLAISLCLAYVTHTSPTRLVFPCRASCISQTLFTVSSRVEAIGGGGEFCRAGSMCHLCLTVTRMHPAAGVTGTNHHQQQQHHHPPPQLMYEVLADQTMWAVCGRTAGIVSLEVLEKQSVTLDVMPLTSGYLPLPVVRLSRYIPAAVELKNGNRNLCLMVLFFIFFVVLFCLFSVSCCLLLIKWGFSFFCFICLILCIMSFMS